ncbi:MAG TPA: hypothetical protein VKZ81_22550 [Pseudonocardia sp.]|jgi:hypothetical protein|uniref:hypothetical protein n=1 Tax=Pseudonocardia sp. TaxID=60912 RepID=UPI002B4B0D43|nr:hypothetical protein [Pseudonocardia sp.]HLU58249.1 hypothetical protein [Pseudonocardia sp.]
MPGKDTAGLLRVRLEAVPAVRAAFEEALTELRPHLLRLQQEAIIAEAWLGDDTSKTVVAHYDSRVIAGAEGPLVAMRQYEQELTRILESLKAIETSYPQVDDANAERFLA